MEPKAMKYFSKICEINKVLRLIMLFVQFLEIVKDETNWGIIKYIEFYPTLLI